jgi:hypothetical protein
MKQFEAHMRLLTRCMSSAHAWRSMTNAAGERYLRCDNCHALEWPVR